MKKRLSIFTMLCMVLMFSSVLNLNVSAAKLNKNKVTLLKSKNYTIQLKGTKAKDKITWKASNNVRITRTNGRKTAINIKAIRAGKAVVTAKIGKKTYKCNVTVADPKINKTKLVIEEGKATNLVVRGGTGRITWKSSNPSKVAVNSQGKITTKKPGTIKVTAIQNNKKMVCNIVVKEKQRKSKQVWVVTKEACTEYVPIYEETYFDECLTCGELFNSETQFEEYEEHCMNHLLNDEPSSSRGKVDRKLLYIKEIHHPEEGYWKTVYY